MHGRDGEKISASWLSLTQHTSPLSGSIQTVKTLAKIAVEKSVTDFMRKKEKWTNKKNDMHEDVHFSLTQYNYSYPMFVPNFKIIGAVVPEKSLTKKILEKK